MFLLKNARQRPEHALGDHTLFQMAIDIESVGICNLTMGEPWYHLPE